MITIQNHCPARCFAKQNPEFNSAIMPFFGMMCASRSGNCEGTVAGEVITTENGVKMIGYTDLAARLPAQSSQLYSTNLVNLAKLLCKNKDGNINVDFEDVVLRNMTVTKAGERGIANTG